MGLTCLKKDLAPIVGKGERYPVGRTSPVIGAQTVLFKLVQGSSILPGPLRGPNGGQSPVLVIGGWRGRMVSRNDSQFQ